MVEIRHFAEIENNLVIRIIAVHNSSCLDSNNEFDETIGASFCKSFTGSSNDWLECSTDDSIRKQPCNVGMIYNEQKNGFHRSSPIPSWVLNDSCVWCPPVPMPSGILGFHWDWDETNVEWVSVADTPK